MALLVALLAGCGDAEVTARERPARERPTQQASDCPTYSVTGYSLSEDPKGAVAFSGNPEIFEATVEQVDPVTKVGQPGMAVPFLVYVPVRVTVTKAYKGTVSAGDSVVLRDLGGRAPDCTSFVTDMGFPDSTWQPGTTLFVFSQEATSPEGKSALTPNWVFVTEDGVARSARDRDKSMGLEQMRAGVEQRWPRP